MDTETEKEKEMKEFLTPRRMRRMRKRVKQMKIPDSIKEEFLEQDIIDDADGILFIRPDVIDSFFRSINDLQRQGQSIFAKQGLNVFPEDLAKNMIIEGAIVTIFEHLGCTRREMNRTLAETLRYSLAFAQILDHHIDFIKEFKKKMNKKAAPWMTAFSFCGGRKYWKELENILEAINGYPFIYLHKKDGMHMLEKA